MKGKLYKENDGYSLFVDGKIFGDTKGHYLSSITNTLSLKNCQSIEHGYDLDKLISESDTSHLARWTSDSHELMFDEGFKIGFQKALELMGDKIFTLDDMYTVFIMGREGMEDKMNRYVTRIHEPIEWDVEIEMHIVPEGWENQPRLDAEGYLILKRI